MGMRVMQCMAVEKCSVWMAGIGAAVIEWGERWYGYWWWLHMAEGGGAEARSAAMAAVMISRPCS